MLQPFFSIIIPVYNEERFLKTCLESVFSQDFPTSAFEVIVVDNNSQDGSLKVASLFPAIIIQEKQQGVIFARNTGLKLARGEVVINLDADCQVAKDWLKKIHQHFQKNNQLIALTGPCYHNEKDVFSHSLKNLLLIWERCFGDLCGYWAGNVAIRRVALNKIGGYDLRFPVDQLSLIHELNRFGKTSLDPTLLVKTSDRRLKNRKIKFIWEASSFFLNTLTIRLLNKALLKWENIR